MIKIVAWLAALALATYVGIGVYEAGRNERLPPPANSQIVFKNGRANGQRLRFKSWSADYDKIISNADQTILQLENVHNGTIYKNGKAYLHVRAAHMTVNTVSRNFTANGPLHVETVGTTPARSFETTSAIWSDAAQKLTFAQRIVIHSGADDPLTVGSLTLDVKSGNVDIRDVTGPIHY
ncbi:MAG: hypothetical protein NVSMB19_23580 [Vulcanimicrobiaceae bacterium]